MNTNPVILTSSLDFSAFSAIAERFHFGNIRFVMVSDHRQIQPDAAQVLSGQPFDFAEFLLFYLAELGEIDARHGRNSGAALRYAFSHDFLDEVFHIVF